MLLHVLGHSTYSTLLTMRLLSCLAPLVLICSSVLAAKSNSSPSAFDSYKSTTFPLELDEAGYNDLTTGPRDYHAAILLTARPAKYACQICKDFDSEWSLIGRTFQKGDRKNENRILVSTVDFDNGRNVFMKLQLQTAPVLLLFPPTTGPHASSTGQPTRLDFAGPQSAESVHSWLIRHLPSDPKTPYPTIQRPINYTRIVASITILLGLFTFGTVAYPYIVPIIGNRNLWAAISLILVLLFTSGHMFNHIRKVPYITGDGKGGITYFAGGFQNQFGMETQIVAAMCKPLLFSHPQSPPISSELTPDHRRNPLLRNHLPRPQSTSNQRRPHPANRRHNLGDRPLRHVQLLDECLQGQEWWIPVLDTSFLDSHCQLSD